MGRPVVLADQDDRTLVVVRYNEDRVANENKDIFGTTNRNNIIVYYSTDKQHWSYLDLTPGTDMKRYEANYDKNNWQNNGVLDLFYQPVPSTSNTMVSLLEWNARSYFITNTIWDWQGGNSSGAVNSAANWKVNTYSVSHAPNGAGYNFRFGNANTNGTVDMMSTGLTVGNITFLADTTTTIMSTGPLYQLTLDNSGADSTISLAGTHTIAAQVLLNNDVDISGTGTLNLSGGISGDHGMNILSGNINAASIQLSHLYIGSGAKLAIMASAGEPLGAQFNPVPEPSTWLLLTIGALCALGYGRWRKFR